MKRKYETKDTIYSLFLLTFILIFCLLIAASFAQAKSLSFEWDANIEQDLAGYRLYQSETSGTYQFSLAGAYIDISGRQTEYTIADYSDITIQYFVLTAYDDKGNESGPSNEVSHIPDIDSPEAPQDFEMFTSIYLAGRYTLFFRWTANIEEDLAEYRLYMAEISNQYDPNASIVISKDMVTYTLMGIETETPLFFVLRAIDNIGNISASSNEAVFIPDFEAPADPQGFSITINVNVNP